MLVVKKTSKVFNFIHASPLVHAYGCVSALSLETGKFCCCCFLFTIHRKGTQYHQLHLFLVVVKNGAGIIYIFCFQYWSMIYLHWLFEHHWRISTKLAVLLVTVKVHLYHISLLSTIGNTMFGRSLVGTEYGCQSMSLSGWFCSPPHCLLTPAKFPWHQQYPWPF